MLKTYPKFKRFEVEEIYKKLSDSEKKLITDYLFYRESCGLQKTDEVRRTILKIKKIIECDFKDFKELEQHTRLVVLIKKSDLAYSVKQNMKIDLNNFFGEYLFSDWWSAKFRRIYSNKNGKKGDSSKPKKDTIIVTDDDIKKMLIKENSTYWRTFLLLQDVTGMRTKECRTTELSKITYNNDKTSTIEVYMTKTGKTKIVFADTETTTWIKKLIEEHKTMGKIGKYLFPSRHNSNIPISKDIVNKWFRKLAIGATGKHLIPYGLRKKKATLLYGLAKNNKIAESTALRLMGHSKSQMGVYDMTPKDEEIKILKSQAFNIEVSPEKKHELEIKLDNMQELLIWFVGKDMGNFDVKDREKAKMMVEKIRMNNNII